MVHLRVPSNLYMVRRPRRRRLHRMQTRNLRHHCVLWVQEGAWDRRRRRRLLQEKVVEEQDTLSGTELGFKYGLSDEMNDEYMNEAMISLCRFMGLSSLSLQNLPLAFWCFGAVVLHSCLLFPL